jgi:hypothetical protein
VLDRNVTSPHSIQEDGVPEKKSHPSEKRAIGNDILHDNPCGLGQITYGDGQIALTY